MSTVFTNYTDYGKGEQRADGPMEYQPRADYKGTSSRKESVEGIGCSRKESARHNTFCTYIYLELLGGSDTESADNTISDSQQPIFYGPMMKQRRTVLCVHDPER